MNMHKKAFVLTLGLGVCLAVAESHRHITADELPSVTQIPTAVSPDRRPLMMGKLEDSQTVLRGLVIADFRLIRKAADRMLDASLYAELAKMHDDPGYQHFSIEFRRLTKKLNQMAEQENADGAAYAFQGITTTCIACHQHVRDSMSLAD